MVLIPNVGAVADMAFLANAAYQDNGAVSAQDLVGGAGWTILDNQQLSPSEGGFSAGYYNNGPAAGIVATRGDVLAIAFRGTDDLKEDSPGYLDQTGHYLDLKPLIEAALAYAAANPAITQIYVSGHSLGGMMAEFFAMDYGDDGTIGGVPRAAVQVATFGAPPISPDPFQINIDTSNDLSDRMARIEHELDVVGDLPGAIDAGTVYEFSLPHAGDEHDASHYLMNMLAMAGSPLQAQASGVDRIVIIGDRRTPEVFNESYDAPDELPVIGTIDYFILGDAGNDHIQGGNGRDYVDAGAGADTVTGALGDDVVMGRTGDDQILGRGGADLLYGNQGLDLIYGNQQSDTVYGGQHMDRIYGGQDPDIVYGNNDTDIVYGNNANDTLYGGQNDDTLYGGQNDDWIFGNLGNDVLFGNRGNDILIGNDGADLFAIGFNFANDTINDFQFGVDKLALTLSPEDMVAAGLDASNTFFSHDGTHAYFTLGGHGQVAFLNLMSQIDPSDLTLENFLPGAPVAGIDVLLTDDIDTLDMLGFFG